MSPVARCWEAPILHGYGPLWPPAGRMHSNTTSPSPMPAASGAWSSLPLHSSSSISLGLPGCHQAVASGLFRSGTAGKILGCTAPNKLICVLRSRGHQGQVRSETYLSLLEHKLSFKCSQKWKTATRWCQDNSSCCTETVSSNTTMVPATPQKALSVHLP